MLNPCAVLGEVRALGGVDVSSQGNGKEFWHTAGPSPHRKAGRRREKDAGGRQPAEDRKNWDSRPDTERWLAHSQLADGDNKISYRIQGLLAERGTSVWFGAGSTGKTQLMLWMAAMIATRPEDRREQVWLGGRVHGTGHVLILSAEDTREQIMMRLRDIVASSIGQDEAAQQRTCSRLHVMPFLSMTEDEFGHPNPSLLEVGVDKVWRPTGVMEEIRHYIKEWNRTHAAEDDRIVGVIMDSATSMAGFDSLDAQATTNFFFYLGRLCEILKMFWVVIGHTPKVTTIPLNNARATAASRLRGVAMWTTAPRMTVEVRLIQEWKTKAGVIKERENKKLRSWLGDRVDAGNILVAYVAKANLKDAWREERYLVRRPRGAFTDVTDFPEEVLPELDREKEEWDKDRAIAPSECQPDHGRESTMSAAQDPSGVGRGPAARGRPKVDQSFFFPGTQLVYDVIRGFCIDVRPGERISANDLRRLIAEHYASDPNAALVTSASGGGKRPSRPGSINWHLDRLVEFGDVQKIGRFYHLVQQPPADG